MAISPDRFKSVIGESLSEMFGFEFWVLERMGMVYKENDHYRLTDDAACLYHNIEQIYTIAYIDKMWNISRNIAFPEEIVLR